MAWNTKENFVAETLSFEDDFIPADSIKKTIVLEDSEEYLKKLESRLKRVKADTSKHSMLQGLEETRQSHMSQLISSSNVITDFIEDLEGKPNEASYIERKLFPERTAISAEELQVLTEADVLEKVTDQLEMSNSETVQQNQN